MPPARLLSLRNIVAASLIVASIVAVAVNYLYRQPADHDRAEAPRFENAMIDAPRPAFTLRDIDGIPRTASAWDGKVLVVNFWATWCRPCLREIPMFNRLQTEHGDAGLQLVGIAIDEPDAIRAFLKTTAVDYPILAGQQDAIDVAVNYGNDVGVLPYTVIVDRAGRIRHVQFGELSETLAYQVIEPLL
jgi:peroxiredoxin